ncbi:hypothetical protein [Tateyamaria sp.]|uniref:hypothetical protein n=1 Tax=Tateyamaria sp. TaxID=1929288 RepID=UPI003B22344A
MATNDNTNPGTENDEAISGTSDADTLTGALGSDTITGGDGADVLSGDGPVEGAWLYEAYDYDFSSAAGQAFDIENGTLIGTGYVSDFNEGGAGQHPARRWCQQPRRFRGHLYQHAERYGGRDIPSDDHVG